MTTLKETVERTIMDIKMFEEETVTIPHTVKVEHETDMYIQRYAEKYNVTPDMMAHVLMIMGIRAYMIVEGV